MLCGALSGLAGFMMAQNEPRIVPEETLADMPADADDARIASGAAVTWSLYYEMCGHTVTMTTEADESMVGLSFAQLDEKYPDVRIVSFSASKIELKRSYACYCPDHFILKRHGEKLVVFATAKGSDKQDIYTTLQIDFDDIPQNEREALEIGRVFGSFADLEAFVSLLLEP